MKYKFLMVFIDRMESPKIALDIYDYGVYD